MSARKPTGSSALTRLMDVRVASCASGERYDVREYRDIECTTYKHLTLNRDHTVKSSDARIHSEVSDTSGVSGAR